MPWKTQAIVPQILRNEYANAPGGMSGNEDSGQMSAWYVFVSLGFYPVCTGIGYYVIASPECDKATIRLENGNHFEIITHRLSPENIYIQSATLNGEKLPLTPRYYKGWNIRIRNGEPTQYNVGISKRGFTSRFFPTLKFTVGRIKITGNAGSSCTIMVYNMP
jgi:hypothetical protein